MTVAEQSQRADSAGSSEPPMSKKTKQSTNNRPKTTPTFLLEPPLQVNSQQAKRLRGHFEAARHLYHALLGEAVKRLRHMRAESRWRAARLIPRSDQQARKAAFAALQKRVRLFGIRLACLCDPGEYLLDCRPRGCQYGPDPGESCLSRRQSGLRRHSQAGPLPQLWTRSGQSGGQGQYAGDPLRAPASP